MYVQTNIHALIACLDAHNDECMVNNVWMIMYSENWNERETLEKVFVCKKCMVSVTVGSTTSKIHVLCLGTIF